MTITFLPGGWPTTFTREQQLSEEVRQLRARLVEYEEQAIGYGVVVKVADGRATISLGGGQVIERSVGVWAKDARPGMGAKITTNGAKLISFCEAMPGQGIVVDVERVHKDAVEYTAMGQQRTAALGKDPVKPGDRVILNAGCDVVMRNLGPGGTATVHTKETGVSWDDIGGLVEAKRQLREAIEEPVKRKKLYARFGKKPCRGIALFGPSGTGKTMLAKAAATAIAELHGASARTSGFIYCKGPDLLDHMLGGSEGRVRALFSSARAHWEKEGYPALIFLDEADGLLMRRGGRHWEGAERTIVPQFLAEMDGLDSTGSLVIIATNRPGEIDPAFLRDGRIDKKIHVARPSQDECVEIFQKHLRGRPTESRNEKALAKAGVEYLFSEGNALYLVRGKDPKDDARLTLGKLASGALVAGIVERATQFAIRRSVEAGDEDNGTIVRHDLRAAVEEVLAEQRHLGHDEDLAALVEPIGKEKIRTIERAK
jgi:proteasome-associated ATPase